MNILVWFFAWALAVAAPPVTPAKIITQAELDYPIEAGGIRGEVEVIVSIDAKGRASPVRVKSGPAAFWEEAEAAVTRLEFEPAVQGGKAVDCLMVVRFEFEPPPLEEALEEIYIRSKSKERWVTGGTAPAEKKKGKKKK